jgi:hypothetical protein
MPLPLLFDPLLPLMLGGALASGSARARRGQHVVSGVMPSKQADHCWRVPDEGGSIGGRCSSTPYAAANETRFIAAGMAEVRMAAVLAGFWSARAIADTVLVWTTDRVFDTIEDVFAGAWGNWLALGLQLLGLASVVLLYWLPWARWLRRLTRPKARRGVT